MFQSDQFTDAWARYLPHPPRRRHSATTRASRGVELNGRTARPTPLPVARDDANPHQLRNVPTVPLPGPEAGPPLPTARPSRCGPTRVGAPYDPNQRVRMLHVPRGDNAHYRVTVRREPDTSVVALAAEFGRSSGSSFLGVPIGPHRVAQILKAIPSQCHYRHTAARDVGWRRTGSASGGTPPANLPRQRRRPKSNRCTRLCEPRGRTMLTILETVVCGGGYRTCTITYVRRPLNSQKSPGGSSCPCRLSRKMIVATKELENVPGPVAMVSGGFDPLHEGHVAYFAAAQDLGVPVLCNVTGDSYVSQKHPPLLSQDRRALLIDAIRHVAYTHVSNLATHEVLEMLSPRFFVKGRDWRSRLPEQEISVCAAAGTEIVYADTVLDSSTALLERWMHRAAGADAGK